MARKRMIDPSIWQSEDFGKLSTLAKIVFIGLFSLAGLLHLSMNSSRM